MKDRDPKFVEAEFINMTLGDFLDDIAAKYPDNDALVYVSRGLRYSYKEFNEVCRQAAKGFLKMGIKKGDHVAMWATNYAEWVITMFATAKIGAVLVTVNTNYKIFEAEYLLKQSDSNTLLLINGLKDTSYVDIINRLCPELKDSTPGELHSEKLPVLKNVIYLDEGRPDGMFTWNDLMEMGNEVSDEELARVQGSLDIYDVVNMQYTSGTTGFPKGVMLTHHNILNDGFYIGECMKFSHKDRLCIPVPFFHCFGCVLAILACVTHGTTMVPVEVYSPTAVMNAIQVEKCTAVHGVPTMFIFMLEHPDFEKYDLSSLRTGIMAGSPCPISVMQDVVNKMHMSEITIVYGQTESSPGCTMSSTDDPLEVRVATVGANLPEIECRIVDPETGEELPDNVTGEFVARGYNIMKGYYKMPKATAAAIDRDGWLHTGDLACRTPDGHYRITGRLKDMIIRGGENIYPKEIEEFIYTHPKVKDVQVIGVPDEQYGEEICACIVLKDGEEMTEDEMKKYILDHMARHKVPKYIDFVDSFPMNVAGKILKYKMREDAVERHGLRKAAEIETA